MEYVPQQTFPTQGLTKDEIRSTLETLRVGDADWRNGRTFSLVYTNDYQDLQESLHLAADMFLHENALNPFAFPSLETMQGEIVKMTANLFHRKPDENPFARGGTLTSGGTESIFLAVQTARDSARANGIAEPNFIVPETAHPAFAKAAHYLDMEMRSAGLTSDYRVDVEQIKSLIDDDTAMIVGSAPCYPYGVIDPIEKIAALAQERELLCHVDACLGGWLLPFWEKIGESVPLWDFRVPGVTSISSDIHKYGYTFKGASVILYRDAELTDVQYFFYEWPGGIYGSPTTAGTRSGAPIAGAWTAIRFLGEEGYNELAKQVREATQGFIGAIEACPELRVIGKPNMSVFAFTSDTVDISAVGDRMDERGWHLDRQQDGLHIMVNPYHRNVIEQFAQDLKDSVANHGESSGKAATYGFAFEQ